MKKAIGVEAAGMKKAKDEIATLMFAWRSMSTVARIVYVAAVALVSVILSSEMGWQRGVGTTFIAAAIGWSLSALGSRLI